MENSCIFCKIANKQIPAEINYEDDKFIGFLDIKPVEKGHTLLIPKEHFVWMQEAPDEIISEIFITVKKLMQKMITELPCDYVEVKVIGVDVPHFHIHIIPRKINK